MSSLAHCRFCLWEHGYIALSCLVFIFRVCAAPSLYKFDISRSMPLGIPETNTIYLFMSSIISLTNADTDFTASGEQLPRVVELVLQKLLSQGKMGNNRFSPCYWAFTLQQQVIFKGCGEPSARFGVHNISTIALQCINLEVKWKLPSI